MLNAILWITRTGSQWRNRESKYPNWQVVYYYFRMWTAMNTLEKLLMLLVSKERINQGREASPSLIAVDSQSVKKVGLINLDTGIDGGKKINGRKGYLAVDSLGLPIAISVSPANMHNSEGGLDLLWQLEKTHTTICNLWRYGL